MALPADPNLVVISSSQMFGELRELTRSQDRIESKVDTITAAQTDAVRRQESQREDHEERLRALEARRWPLPVACAVLSALSSGIALYALLQAR